MAQPKQDRSAAAGDFSNVNDKTVRSLSESVAGLAKHMKSMAGNGVNGAIKPLGAVKNAVGDQFRVDKSKSAAIGIASAANPVAGMIAERLMSKHGDAIKSSVMNSMNSPMWKMSIADVYNKVHKGKATEPARKMYAIDKYDRNRKSGKNETSQQKLEKRKHRRLDHSSYDQNHTTGDIVDAIDLMRISNAEWMKAIATQPRSQIEKKPLPKAANGGYVNGTGQAIVHKGELIVPAKVISSQVKLLESMNESLQSMNTAIAGETGAMIKGFDQVITKKLIKSPVFSAMYSVGKMALTMYKFGMKYKNIGEGMAQKYARQQIFATPLETIAASTNALYGHSREHLEMHTKQLNKIIKLLGGREEKKEKFDGFSMKEAFDRLILSGDPSDLIDVGFNKMTKMFSKNKAPKAAKGGYVKRTGRAIVHAGEKILPASMVTKLDKADVKFQKWIDNTSEYYKIGLAERKKKQKSKIDDKILKLQEKISDNTGAISAAEKESLKQQKAQLRLDRMKAGTGLAGQAAGVISVTAAAIFRPLSKALLPILRFSKSFAGILSIFGVGTAALGLTSGFALKGLVKTGIGAILKMPFMGPIAIAISIIDGVMGWFKAGEFFDTVAPSIEMKAASFAAGVVDGLYKIIQIPFNLLAKHVLGIPERLPDIEKPLAHIFHSVIKSFEFFYTMFKPLIPVMKSSVSFMLKTITKVGKITGDFLLFIPRLLSEPQAAFKGLANVISELCEWLIQDVPKFLWDAFVGVTKTFGNVMSVALVTIPIKMGKALATAVWMALRGLVFDIPKFIVKTLWAGLKYAFIEIPDKIANGISSISDALVEEIPDAIFNMVTGVIDWIIDLPRVIADASSGSNSYLADFAIDVVKSVVSGIKDITLTLLWQLPKVVLKLATATLIKLPLALIMGTLKLLGKLFWYSVFEAPLKLLFNSGYLVKVALKSLAASGGKIGSAVIDGILHIAKSSSKIFTFIFEKKERSKIYKLIKEKVYGFIYNIFSPIFKAVKAVDDYKQEIMTKYIDPVVSAIVRPFKFVITAWGNIFSQIKSSFHSMTGGIFRGKSRESLAVGGVNNSGVPQDVDVHKNEGIISGGSLGVIGSNGSTVLNPGDRVVPVYEMEELKRRKALANQYVSPSDRLIPSNYNESTRQGKLYKEIVETENKLSSAKTPQEAEQIQKRLEYLKQGFPAASWGSEDEQALKDMERGISRGSSKSIASGGKRSGGMIDKWKSLSPEEKDVILRYGPANGFRMIDAWNRSKAIGSMKGGLYSRASKSWNWLKGAGKWISTTAKSAGHGMLDIGKAIGSDIKGLFTKKPAANVSEAVTEIKKVEEATKQSRKKVRGRGSKAARSLRNAAQAEVSEAAVAAESKDISRWQKIKNSITGAKNRFLDTNTGKKMAEQWGHIKDGNVANTIRKWMDHPKQWVDSSKSWIAKEGGIAASIKSAASNGWKYVKGIPTKVTGAVKGAASSAFKTMMQDFPGGEQGLEKMGNVGKLVKEYLVGNGADKTGLLKRITNKLGGNSAVVKNILAYKDSFLAKRAAAKAQNAAKPNIVRRGIDLIKKIPGTKIGQAIGRQFTNSTTANMIGKIGPAIAKAGGIKAVAIGGLKAGANILGKVAPGAGLLLGAASAVDRFRKGQWIRGGVDILSGIAGLFPGPGTALALALSAGNAGYDMYEAAKLANESNDPSIIEANKIAQDPTHPKYKDAVKLLANVSANKQQALPKASIGGYVRKTGKAIVHSGEMIVPASKVAALKMNSNFDSSKKAAMQNIIRAGLIADEKNLKGLDFIGGSVNETGKANARGQEDVINMMNMSISNNTSNSSSNNSSGQSRTRLDMSFDNLMRGYV